MTTAMAERTRSIDELRDLYGQLHEFGLDLREASLRFQDLVRNGHFGERGGHFRYAEGDQKNLLNRSIDITRNFEFMVAMTGAFSSGKSTLLNLLLEQEDLLPSSVIPLTAVCTVIRYGDEPRVRVRYVSKADAFARIPMCLGRPLLKKLDSVEQLPEVLDHPEHFIDGEAAQASLKRFAEVLRRYDSIVERPISFAEREPFIAGGGRLADSSSETGYQYFRPTPKEESDYLAQGGDPHQWVTREWLAIVRDVTLWIPSPLLQNNMVFLDLPGLNCKEDYHRRAIQEYCTMADCILVTAFQPGNQADEEVLRNFKSLSNNYQEKIFFAFNKVDQFASEPSELVRAVDYLARDTIGTDFPQERFFLTSGQLARGRRHGDDHANDLARLRQSLGQVHDQLPGLDRWVEALTNESDPGGVGALRQKLFSFLMTEAYPTKLAEVVRNYRGTLDGLTGAASPVYEESQSVDPSDLLRKSVLEFFRYTDKLQRNALYRFRFDYLRGNASARCLKEDLKQLLERAHLQVRQTIDDYFDQPILSTPLRDDPVGEFDLQKIADEASEKLRRSLQDLVTRIVHDRVQEVFRSYFSAGKFHEHAKNLFRGSADCQRKLDQLLSRFEETMLHSLKCIVRNGFFYMPRGRDLKRLERTVPLTELKDLLVEVFSDFYPNWIYENIYGEVIDRLWLSLFLDCEDLERELASFFEEAEGVITGGSVAEQVQVPTELTKGTRGFYQTLKMCRRLGTLVEKRRELESRAERLGCRL